MPPEPEFDPIPILTRFADAGIDFVVIGGVAGGAHGSAYGTEDVDLAYSRSVENLELLATLLGQLDATLRGAPPDLQFQLDARSLSEGGNFMFETSLGSIDILAFPVGAPPYEQLRAAAAVVEIEGRRVRIASLDHLIAMKEAAGRTKDLLHASEYRVISDELRAPRDST
jgi:hypothetical protein